MNKLKKLLKKKGIKAIQLAKYLGVSKSALSHSMNDLSDRGLEALKDPDLVKHIKTL